MNSIVRVQVRDRTITPAQAEIWITVTPAQPSEDTEVSGRLMGPRCAYSTTVEVAYPLRPLPRSVESSSGLLRRVVIPEPSLWDPESPFLYEGPVELWQAGERRDERTVCHGLRTVHLGARGLRINGHPLMLRGRSSGSGVDEQTLKAWHRAGTNLLLAPVGAASLWEQGDRFGFFVLGRITTAEDLAIAGRLAGHTSALGFILAEEMRCHPALWQDAWTRHRADRFQLLGAEPSPALPPQVDFVLCDEEAFERGVTQKRPALILGPSRRGSRDATASSALTFDEIGYVEE